MGKSPPVISTDRIREDGEPDQGERMVKRREDAGIASGGQASRQESRYFRRTRAYLRAPRQAGYDTIDTLPFRREIHADRPRIDGSPRVDVFVVEPS